MISDAENRPGASVDTGDPTAAQASAARRWRLVYPGFFFLLPVAAVAAPRSLVPLLLVATLLAAAGVWRRGSATPWARSGAGLVTALALLVIWAATASLWSFDPARALWLSIRIAGLLAAGLVLHEIVVRFDPAARRRLGNWLVAGALVALGFLIAEIALGFPVGYAWYSADQLGNDPAVWLNRGAVALAILCWPVAAVLRIKRAKAAAVGVIAGLLAIISVLSSLAAITGLAGGMVFALIANWHRRAGRALLILATIAALIGSPLAGRLLYALDWQVAGWLPPSAQHRVEIWHFTALQFAENPILGWGFDSARGMGAVAAGEEASGRSPIGWHPHNAALQILLELGLVGAAIALAIAWILIQRLEKLAAPARTFAQATYMTALIISCTAYGAWQNWWISLLICAAVSMVLGCRPAAPPDDGAPPQQFGPPGAPP